MPTSRQYLQECNLIISQAWGELTDAELFKHVRALNDLTATVDVVIELGDCRYIKPTKALTVEGITQAASQEIIRPNSRLSLLVPPDNQLLFGLVRAYEMLSKWQRDSVNVHSDMDIALEWLGVANSNFDFVKDHLRTLT